MSYWAVALTQSRAERKAIGHLRDQGFEVYAPRFKSLQVRRGRKQWAINFLFPGYIFIYVADAWRAVGGTPGILSLILDGAKKPAKLPDWCVPSMKEQERGGFIPIPKKGRVSGSRVDIPRGLFAGQSGIYQGMSSRERETVLLDVLGRVELAAGDLD